MNKRVRENISAYLDGEASDAQKIARLIADSGDAAREHASIAELSARMRSLEEPGIHPAFATRVCAVIEAQQERRRIGWRIPAGVAVAALALVVAIVGMNSKQRPTTTVTPTLTAAVPASTAPAPARGEDALLADLENRVSHDAALKRFVTARYENTPQPSELYSEKLIAAVAGSRTGATAGEAFAHGMDYRAAVQRLDDAQADAVKKMLTASMREALEG